ncbi:MFS transporter [Corynebacterium pseudotuberculosis]|uniref:MFS transporter n=1 Tax=Corynebacterium pseudotuberculosis 258 TaxID=1168865 RepID=A0AAU8Q471_CORPS|nr:MFS transporter [Corynebacterium pseudotuberculosis]AER69783.1 Permease, major facilitator family [Corynebacterium pseudotuberculosis 1/06-A]AEQ07306.1 MFS transporter [Corynebacterium pseudotuberculosis CIP 52.97]AFB73122.1 MFS transporter [Corynebacterium pseudotuberculosis 316]AFH91568.1 MFS transporter [Corynebacterium pseudotuberculosis 31]AFK17413.1 MFS transporter [Corynebacterium pseudotuberculosis 258]
MTLQDPVDTRKGGIALLMTVLLTAAIAFQLNASMLSPVLATMARELGTDEATVGLTQTAFFTGGAMCGLFLPRLSDIVGRRKILVIMLAVMAIGGLMAALAPNITVLAIARALQGISGPTIPMTLIILRSQVRDQVRLGTLMGIIAAVNGGIAGIDVIASGWMAEHLGFRSVFWLIAIVGLIATVVVALWAPESKPSDNVKMDWVGAAILVVSVLSITLAANEAGKAAAANWMLVVGLILFGLAVFAVFWKWENKHDQPMVAPKYLARRQTWGLLLTTVLTMTGVFAAVNGVAISLAQNPDAGFGLPADLASLMLLTPYALIGWLVGPFAGRWAPRIGYSRLLRIGNASSAVLLLVLALAGSTSKVVLIASVVLLGITYAGIGNIVLNNLGVVNSPADNEGFLPGMNSAAFNLGAGISFAVLPVFMVAGSPAGSDSTAGYTTAFIVGAIILGLSVATSFFIPKRVDA